MSELNNTFKMYGEVLARNFDMLPLDQGWALKKLLYLSEDLFWFKGHFPHQPVLPGIAQLSWAIEIAAKHLEDGRCFYRLDRAKFQRPLSAGETVLLQLKWAAERQVLEFSYHFVTQESFLVRNLSWEQAQEMMVPASSGKLGYRIG